MSRVIKWETCGYIHRNPSKLFSASLCNHTNYLRCNLISSFHPSPSLPFLTVTETAQKYYAVEDYAAEEADEISFKKGVTVDVLQKSLDGWWLIRRLDKQVGLAPATFLKKCDSFEVSCCCMDCRTFWL